MNNKKRAYKDAQEDYIIEQAWIKNNWWKIFVTFTLLGIGSKFFWVVP